MMLRGFILILALIALTSNAFSKEHESHAKKSHTRTWDSASGKAKEHSPHWTPGMLKALKTAPGMDKAEAAERLKHAQLKRKADQAKFNDKVREETESRETRKMLKEEKMEAIKQRAQMKKDRVKSQMFARKQMKLEKDLLKTPLGEKVVREIRMPDQNINKDEYMEMKKEAKRLVQAHKNKEISKEEFHAKMKELKISDPRLPVNFREAQVAKNRHAKARSENEIDNNMDYAKQMKMVADLERMAKKDGKDASKALAKMRRHLKSLTKNNAKTTEGDHASKERVDKDGEDVAKSVQDVAAKLRKEIRRAAVKAHGAR